MTASSTVQARLVTLPGMNKLILAVVLTLAGVSTFAQDKKVTAADFEGTWNIEVMSHQIALVIDPKDAASVTATMMVMGKDVPLKGTLADRTLTLTGVPGDHLDQASHVAAKPAGAGGQAITVTLQEDGTIAGEMMTNNGPVKWVGEKLKARKKG